MPMVMSRSLTSNSIAVRLWFRRVLDHCLERAKMKLRRIVTSVFAASLLWSVLPVFADAPGSLGPEHGIYLGEGQVLAVESTRQLTLREDIQAYAFSPSGEKIAYVSYVEDHGEQYYALKVVDTWRHEPEVTLLTKQRLPKFIANPPEPTLLEIVGWSGDDRFVLFQRDSSAPGEDDTALPPQIEMIDLSASTPQAKPIPLGTKNHDGSLVDIDASWSPDHDRLVIRRRVTYLTEKPVRTEQNYWLYRPLTDQLQPLPLDPSCIVRGWRDGGHLLIKAVAKDTNSPLQNYELETGTLTEFVRPEGWGKVPLDNPIAPLGAADPKDPSLILEILAHRLNASRQDGLTPASTVWLRQNPAAGKLSVLALGVITGKSPPQAQWSPTGKSIAFVAHGDVFLANLIKRPANQQERLAGGEPWRCPEDGTTAASNMKQIALGILQYTQDNDERLPTASEFRQAITPYLQDESLFSLGDCQFIYHAPKNLSYDIINAPADLIIGEMDTPCGRIVLYADGHVKNLGK
jgi:prepilin-type processing-associated H-X9-DG protein